MRTTIGALSLGALGLDERQRLRRRQGGHSFFPPPRRVIRGDGRRRGRDDLYKSVGR